MGTILNFEKWSRLNESLSTQDIADLKLLDTIQKMADDGPRMEFRGTKATAPETLTTAAGTPGANSSTGQITKTISFMASVDPGDASKKKYSVKAVFFVSGGKLMATIWKNGVQYHSGEVVIKNHGSWKQIIRIGDVSAARLVDMSGAQQVYEDAQAPVTAGIMEIINQKMYAGQTDNLNFHNGTGVSRGKSNVKSSSGSVELIKFAEAAKAKSTKV